MAQFDVVDMNGKKVSTVELSDAVFGITPNEKAVHEAVVNFLANQRQGTQNTKIRKEVRGGGKKPWRQKGTGHGESFVDRKCHKNYKLRNSCPLGKKINFPRPHYMVDGGKKSTTFSRWNGRERPSPRQPTGSPGRPGPPAGLPSPERPVSRGRRGST